jgi:low affinity Fe/Cu permease
MTESNFAQLYAKARGSKTFLYGLTVFIVAWLAISHLTGFDADHGLINLMLSAEASVSLAFFAMQGDKQDMQHREQMDAIVDLLTAIKAEEDTILKEVEHD